MSKRKKPKKVNQEDTVIKTEIKKAGYHTIFKEIFEWSINKVQELLPYGFIFFDTVTEYLKTLPV